MRTSRYLTLADFLKYLWVVLTIVPTACITSGVASYHYISPKYEASSTLFVKSVDLKKDDTEQQRNSDLNVDLTLVKVYQGILTNPTVIGKVAELYPDDKQKVTKMAESIAIHVLEDTPLITVSLNDENYALAANVLNSVVTVFKSQLVNIVDVDNLVVINKANPSVLPSPSNPGPIRNMALSFIVSFAISLLVVYILHARSTVRGQAARNTKSYGSSSETAVY